MRRPAARPVSMSCCATDARLTTYWGQQSSSRCANWRRSGDCPISGTCFHGAKLGERSTMGRLSYVYFSFSGRMSRMSFWLSLLGLIVVESIVMAAVVPFLIGDVSTLDPNDSEAIMAFIMRVNIPIFIIG